MRALKENPDRFQPYAAIGCELPNTACTRRVGVCAFSSRLRGLELVPSKSRYLVPPTRG